jgi:hypothetical protein
MRHKNTAAEKDSVMAMIILLLMAFFFLKKSYWVDAAIVIALVSVLSTRATSYLHRIWLFLTEMLGRLSGGIILTVVFIFVLMPTAIFKRWFGKKEVLLNKKNRVSTFQSRNHTYSEADLENPW